MEEVRISDWPDPPGSHAWLPAYGFQHEIMDKDDYFCSNGDNGSTHALYLETIVEETSDDLRSERSSAATWLSDSDADSVIHVRGAGGSEDSESEREWACPAKRRRRERASSPASSGSLSRSSSLAQFESLERSCAAPASPSLSPDSLESPPSSPPPTRAPAPRTHLSAENLSEDSGYSERSRRPPPPAQRRPPEIAHRPPAAGSAPCLASPSAERRPPRAARALSLPAELDVCAEPRRHVTHRAHFRQTFEVSDNLTVSVADLTALDYRGGSRRPRLPPPPPPPRAARLPLPPPPPPPVDVVTRQPPASPSPSTAREPSAGSDSTTESERAFAREMETTAKRLDESARRALADSGDFDRGLSVLTATRLQESWGVWDDVLDELRRRMEPQSATPTPPRTPSPDPIREPAFTSTPLRSGDARVRSTPELRARATPHRETPEELRASLQFVAPPPPGSAPPARSVSAGSKGVTFSPVVAEVSWREMSTTTTESETTSSDNAADAEVTVVEEGGGEGPRAPVTERAADMTDAGARAPRSRIAGFLSRFANFRFSGRKEKKSRGAGANGRPSQTVASAADAGQGPRGAAAGPQYVRIPLKEEGVSRAAVPPAPGGVAHKPPRPRPPPAPAPGVLETDVDTQRTVLHARSLLALAPPDQRTPRPHKSMEFLLDKESAQTVQQMSDESEISNFAIDKTMLPSTSTAPAATPRRFMEEGDILDTPRKFKLRLQLKQKDRIIKKKNAQIKTLQQKVRRLKKRNKTLKQILTDLKKRNFITELYESLNNNVTAVDIFCNLRNKTLKKKVNYTRVVKKFCLTLNYYSPKGYAYVRNTFNTCLPHPRTLAKWYGSIKGEPGFTEESFQALKAKSEASDHRPLCSLVFDEVSIRAQKIWDGKKYIGLADMGTGADESSPLATQALVFLLVGINHRFKVPLGYFLINSITGEQKANLIKMCLIKCYEADIDVVSVTFDGHSTNFTALELLGCNFKEPSNLKTTFKHPSNNSNIVCFIDPSHVVKLIRNQFEAKKEFQDVNNDKISWDYLVRLNDLQTNDGLHLANKLTKRHIEFRNQIMKVKLATQLFSRSVSDALALCRETFNLPDFNNSLATEKFIRTINDMFDIFNSSTMKEYGFKKPICEANKDKIFSFFEELKNNILELKFKSISKKKVLQNQRSTFLITRLFKPVIESNFKTGFLGILINLESLKILFNTLVQTEKKLVFIPVYKLSQDHLEMFFSSIRLQGGCNDNPNVRQFKGAYRKLLSHLELNCLTTGNYVPLESIAILNCSSSSSAINMTASSYRHEEVDENSVDALNFLEYINEDMKDLLEMFDLPDFNDYKNIIIGYIAGATTHYVCKILKCEKCVDNLLAKKRLNFHKLIEIKNRGGLCFPSEDVHKICTICEVVVRKIRKENINLVQERQHTYIINKILEKFVGDDGIFANLEIAHDFAGKDHKVHLIKCIIEKFLKIRFHHISKQETVSKTVNSKRQKFKKLTQQQGF